MVVTVDGGSNMFSGITAGAAAPWDFSLRPTAGASLATSDVDAQPLDASMRSAAAAAVSSNRSGSEEQSKNNSSNNNKKLRFDMGSDGDAGSVLNPQEDEESRKRRELLARRPSYRKIFNELSEHGGGAAQMGAVPKMEDNDDSNDSLMSNDDDLPPVNAAGGMLTSHASVAGGGMQTLTMTNAASTAAQVANNSTGATIVQYAQGADGQFFIPGNISYHVAPGNPVTQGVVMAAAGGEEASRKRELRLLKNREAARECRRKKKEYIKCLENRVALLENQNKTLIEELKSLKELYCQKDQS